MMDWSIFEYENDYILKTKEKTEDIPFYKFRPKDQSGILPTVVYYHGWSSNKQLKIFTAQIIASYGYQVIVPDSLYHGERNPIDNYDAINLEKYILEVLFKTIGESKSFIDNIIKHHNADANRICIMGSSMGSFSSGAIFISNSDLKCLVGFNGSFSLKDIIEKKGKAFYDGHVKKYDPINNLDKLNDRAILMLHGKEDAIVPIECQRNFFNEAKNYYQNCSDRLQLIESSGLNHQTSVTMLQNTITFLKNFL